MEQQLDVRERLEPRAEARLRLAHALRDRSHAAAVVRVQVQDAIGLAEAERPQHDGLGLRDRDPRGQCRQAAADPVVTTPCKVTLTRTRWSGYARPHDITYAHRSTRTRSPRGASSQLSLSPSRPARPPPPPPRRRSARISRRPRPISSRTRQSCAASRHSFQSPGESLLRAREGGRLRLRGTVVDEALRRHADPRPLEGPLDRGQPVLRARRRRRRRNSVARRLRRDPRRRLEREGGSGERRPVRPEARRRPRPPQAREPLQPHRGHALGNDARVHGQGRQSRSRRRREARVRRGASRRGGVQGVGRGVRAVRGQARSLGPGVEAHVIGRVHRGRRDGADDERVLRSMEGLALRPRRPGAGRLVQRRLAPLGHRRHPRRAASHLRGHPARDRHPSTRSRRRRRSASSTACGPSCRSCASRNRPAAASRREQADSLGRTAQERATAIAGQVTQAAARLKVKIAQ